MTLISCNNKGCLKLSEAKLDTSTNEVICDECGGVITNIAEPMKRTLKSLGHIVRSKTKQAFQTFCKKCKCNVEYYVDDDGKAYCKICKEPVTVSKFFQNAAKMMKDNKDA